PWLGRSTKSERKSGSRPRAIDWKFLPCPNSPCRNTTYGPDPPTSVTDSSLTPTSLGAPPAHPPDRGTPHELERGETLRPAHPGTTVRGALDGRRATEHVLVRCARPPPRPASARRLADDLAQVGVREVARALVELVRVPVLVVQRDVLHRVLAREHPDLLGALGKRTGDRDHELRPQAQALDVRGDREPPERRLLPLEQDPHRAHEPVPRPRTERDDVLTFEVLDELLERLRERRDVRVPRDLRLAHERRPTQREQLARVLDLDTADVNLGCDHAVMVSEHARSA